MTTTVPDPTFADLIAQMWALYPEALVLTGSYAFVMLLMFAISVAAIFETPSDMLAFWLFMSFVVLLGGAVTVAAFTIAGKYPDTQDGWDTAAWFTLTAFAALMLSHIIEREERS